jgi:hypothetical protein
MRLSKHVCVVMCALGGTIISTVALLQQKLLVLLRRICLIGGAHVPRVQRLWGCTTSGLCAHLLVHPRSMPVSGGLCAWQPFVQWMLVDVL